MARYDGPIIVKSEPGQGSELTDTLPVRFGLKGLMAVGESRFRQVSG